MESHKAITKVFNIALFLYFLFNRTIGYLFDPAGDKSVPWDKVYEWSPSLAVSGALVLVLIMALLGAVIVRVFWNRFVVDVFKIREITFDESLAIVLITAILSA